MPRYSGVAFHVQKVETGSETNGYVLSGFLSQNQLEALRDLVDSEEYERSRRWRGEYQELAKAIVGAIDAATPAR